MNIMKTIIRLFVLSLFLFTGNSFAQQLQSYHGQVINESKQPISSASVMVKNSSKGTTTDRLGKFSILAKSNDILKVSAIGYITQEGKVTNLNKPIVLKTESSQTLNDVVVVGYGAEKKNTITGRSAGIMIRGQSSHIKPGYGIYNPNFNTEDYAATEENGFKKTINQTLSTFSLDVDAASYSNIRRFINQDQLPPAGSVRIEEMINYFTYNYPQTNKNEAFSINTEYTTAPWNNQHGLMMINLQAKKISTENLPASNFVFLVDVSGSMMAANKLPLVQESLKLLTDQLRSKDKVTIVTYAGNTSVFLQPTSGNEKIKIKEAINSLSAGGSTHGSAAIQLAYKAAEDNFIKGGNNRIILCTDGDFNVGQTSNAALEKLIEEKRKSGVFLTVLGYGMGNYKDDKMQILAQKGNGNHAYIDGLTEAKKVLINEFGSTLFTIAKDVKFQIEFNPSIVQGYRLIGYETRLLNSEDFNDDKKDAGELGSGHTVTALYEIIPNGVNSKWLKNVDDLKYHNTTPKTTNSTDLATVKLRYKEPDGDKSKLLEKTVRNNKININKASENLRFASAVAGFGMLLSDSEFKQNIDYNKILQQAKNAIGKDEEGYRYEFIQLVKKAESIVQKKLNNE